MSMTSDEPHTTPVPALDRLDGAGLDAIHDASIELLEEVGIKLEHDRARSVFADHGATVEDGAVRLSRDLVQEALDRAPATFTLYGRGPDTTISVGEGDVVRAPGYGPPNIRTVADGRRSSRLADYETLVKLAHVADPINCTGYNVCEPNDVDQSVKHLEMVKRSLMLSDQPLFGSTYGADRARACLDLVGIAHDDPDLSRPYIMGLINTVPPRSIDTKMLGGLMTYAEHGQPVVVSSFTMAGASGPATLAGAMAQANAENLLGITLAQLINPGTPVVYGLPSSNIDIRYGSLSIGSPESALFIAFAGQMGRRYDLPSRAGGSLTDAKAVDYQAGFESMLTMATTAYADVDVVLHAAGILESYSAISPEKFVLDCELMAYLDRFEAGFSIGEDQLALDVIAEVDPAGHFLSEHHTLDHAEDALFRPELADKQSHGDWADAGAKTAEVAASDRVDEMLSAYEPPPIDPATEEALEEAARDRIARIE